MSRPTPWSRPPWAQIFRLLARLNQNNNTTILLISHDLQMMSKWADRVNVLYCGQTVESAQCEELLAAPHHPYTRALIRAMPDFGRSLPHKSRLNTLPGAIPSLEHLPIGCRTAALPLRTEEVHRNAAPAPGQNHFFACHFPLNMEEQ